MNGLLKIQNIVFTVDFWRYFKSHDVYDSYSSYFKDEWQMSFDNYIGTSYRPIAKLHFSAVRVHFVDL